MAVYNSSILGEIGRQLVKAPLAAAISPYPPAQPMHGEIDQPHLTIFDKCVGSLTSPANHSL